MQRDFHYSCIKCLSVLSGFDDHDAQIIAYASQYTDDATEHKGIRITKLPKIATSLVKSNLFEPVCTAHKGIQFLTAIDRNVQKKVYIPFHFLPGQVQGQVNGLFNYTTQPDSPFSNKLLNEAGGCIKKADKGEDRQFGLIKLGLALHTYADTWSHHRFSGRWCAADNDIERISLFLDNKWEPIGFIKQVSYNIIPDIGHAEALNFPDQTHLSWRYEHDSSGLQYTRNNTAEFMEAAKAIYSFLCGLNGTPMNWKGIIRKVEQCLSLDTDSVKSKEELWRNTFPDIRFDYNSEAWRSEALSGDRLDWDHFQDADDFATLKFTARGDLKWFQFHLAASEQRAFVLANIPVNLL